MRMRNWPTGPLKASRFTMAKVSRLVSARRAGPSNRPIWLAAKITGPDLGMYRAPCTFTRQPRRSPSFTSGRVSRRTHSFGAGSRSVCGRSGLTPWITPVSKRPDRNECADRFDHLLEAEERRVDDTHSGSRRFELGNHGIVTVPADDLIGDSVDIHPVLSELGMSPRDSRGRVSDEENAYVGVGCHHGGDVSPLSDYSINCLGDQLLLPGAHIGTN